MSTLDGQNVKLSGAQNVTGTKSFTVNQHYNTGANITLYNTADKVTNVEAGALRWQGNVLTLDTSFSGTGVLRGVQINGTTVSLAAGMATFTAATLPFVNLSPASAVTAGGTFTRARGNFTGAAGMQTSFEVAPTIAQSGSAGYTALDVNPTITTTGSGAQLLQRWATSSTARAQMTSTGQFSAISMNAGTVGAGLSILESSTSFGSGIASTAVDLTLSSAHCTVLVDASAAARTITLPTAASSTRRIYTIKKIDASANTVTIDGNASEVIDGATTQVLATQWSALTIQSNGTSWFITAKV